jgi:hypothetical protein
MILRNLGGASDILEGGSWIEIYTSQCSQNGFENVFARVASKNSQTHPLKNEPRMIPGPELPESPGKSVAGDDRAAEFVVHAQRDHIHGLTDLIDHRSSARRHGEGIVRGAHEQVVVFDAG